MQFDYTFVSIYGFILFEPLIAVTNLFLLVSALYYFIQLNKYKQRFSKQFALFILFTGITGIFGTLAHGVHYQWGDGFFNGMLFLMNLSSLLSALYCFFAVYSYLRPENGGTNRVVVLAWLWLAVLILYTFVYNEFVVVKVHVGIVLVFTLLVFSLKRMKNDPGSKLIISGILVGLLTVVVHTLQIRFHEWFNHKDLSHVFMLLALNLLFRGAELNSRHMLERRLAMAEI